MAHELQPVMPTAVRTLVVVDGWRFGWVCMLSRAPLSPSLSLSIYIYISIYVYIYISLSLSLSLSPSLSVYTYMHTYL